MREKEALAIIYACETFRPYLYGIQFTVETDHQSLQWMMKAVAPARLVRWALRLAEYDFIIKYKKGSSNANAEALSRLPIDHDQSNSGEVLNAIFTQGSLLTTILEQQRADIELMNIIEQLERSEGAPQLPFCIDRDLLYFTRYDGKLLLVVPQSVITEILELHQAHEFSVHMSRDRLYQLPRNRYYWPGMFKDVSGLKPTCPGRMVYFNR